MMLIKGSDPEHSGTDKDKCDVIDLRYFYYPFKKLLKPIGMPKYCPFSRVD
jgi:hypothetical protein